MINKEKLQQIQDKEQKRKKHLQINLSQKSAWGILPFIGEAFVRLLSFMVIYRKYPYNLAYMRIDEVLGFLDRVNCKNKQQIIEECIFDGIEDEEDVERRIYHNYPFFETIREYQDSNDKSELEFYNYERKVYIYDEVPTFNVTPKICKNFLRFRQLFLLASQEDCPYYLRDTDFWHYACEYLLMEDNDFRMFIYGPKGKNFDNILEEQVDEL